MICAGIIVAGLACDYGIVRQKERRLSAAVSDCGGRNGSIPLWPIGTEYRIALNRVPDENQLKRLQIANEMRGWVGIAFDCPLSDTDRLRLTKLLPKCHLSIVRDRRRVPLTHDALD
jgi:hypothetical protein